jgi:acetyl-CoA carboxylase biotin carboxyl carrier protein
VSESVETSGGPFDVSNVRQLIELMKEFDINQIDLRDGVKRLHLRRGQAVVTTTVAAAPVMAAPQMAGPGASIPVATAPVSKLLDVKSPMVGTFYAKPAPDKDDYVKVGSKVSADTIVCKVEAMKIFNDLPAGVSGVIAEVCVQNGQFVEFDSVLFRVDPS